MKKIILLVEDSPTQAMILENTLQKKDYEVIVATDGEAAIEWLSDHSADLVISDILMPKLDGFELCKRIKNQFKTHHIPVILLTSLSGTEEVIEGLIAGADSFITKPFDEEYLLMHMQKILLENSRNADRKFTSENTFGIEIELNGKNRIIQSDHQHIIKLLLNIYDGAIHQNNKLIQTQEQLRVLNENLGILVEERTAELSEEIEIRKNTEKELKISEQRLQYVLQGSRLGYWDWEIPTNIVKRNERWAEILGYKLEDIEFTVKQWLDFIHPDDQALALKSVQDNMEGKIPTHRLEYRMKTKEGDHKWILDQAQVVQWDENGKPLRMSGTHTDITELKIAEAEIKNMNEELMKSNAEKDKFFAIIAHDLRGPLGTFLGLTEFLAEEMKSLNAEDIENLVDSMRKSALGLNGLLNNLLEWARLHQGLLTFEFNEVSLPQLLQENLELVQEQANNKNIQIFCPLPDKMDVLADTYSLQAILRNLTSNALKFTPKGGKIWISAKQKDQQFAEIIVRDSGIGMSPSILQDLFKLNAKTNRKGTEGEPTTGLGLLLCKEFIEKNGGALFIKSEENKGSEFSFTIPLATKGLKLPNESSQLLLVDKNDNQQKLNILIAEDDDSSAFLLERIIRNYVREISRVITGLEAVEMCRTNPDIDLILMDVNMPVMNGFEACRKIREFNKQVKIIVQSAYNLNEDDKEAVTSGYNDYISKPISKEKFLQSAVKYFPQI